ncbi:unannotated protein [freshwater metagenome]|uniref:Unannotated protein n=1 Tax=freshwater metagenome TaxID=449393 RepID=A0A6J7RE12_9ZZZZ
MIGEVGFAQHEQAGHVRHEVVVDPQTAHRVVHGGIDAHGNAERVVARDAFVHLEQVVVAILDGRSAVASDGFGEVEEHTVLERTHAAAFVDHGLGIAGGHVAGHEVAERRVLALEEVVAFGFGDLIRGPGLVVRRGDPDASVVAERFGHEGELGLELVARRDARGVDLRVAGVREQCAPAVSAPRCGHVGHLGVCAEVVDVAVAARGEQHGVAGVRRDLTGDHIAHDHTRCSAVGHHEVEHLAAHVQLDVAERDLAHEGAVRAEQQLLAGLAPRVERARYLCAAEGAVVEAAAVFAGEWHALRDGLVDDVHRYLGQPVHVGLAGAVVAALDGVVEQPVHAVAVVLVVLCAVDAALRGDGVGTPRGVVEGEELDLVAELTERCGRGCARETRADDDDVELALVVGVDELGRELVVGPLVLHGPGRDVGLQFTDHVSAPLPSRLKRLRFRCTP